MFILDIINSYIKKAGFDPDQPRDEKGRWGSGGSSEARDLLSKKSPKDINRICRHENKNINKFLYSWQESSTFQEAALLKAKVNSMEGLNVKSRLGSEDVMDVLTNSRIAYGGDDSREPLVSLSDKQMESLKNELGIKGDLEEEARKQDSNLYSRDKEVVDKAEAFFSKVCNTNTFKSVLEESANKNIPDKEYHLMREGSQIMMDKQKYPDTVRLYRGVKIYPTAEELTKIANETIEGKDPKINIPVDVISSWTTRMERAKGFATGESNPEGSGINGVGVILVKDVPRKDIFVSSGMIQHNMGAEREHIVINKSGVDSIPMSKIYFPDRGWEVSGTSFRLDDDLKESKQFKESFKVGKFVSAVEGYHDKIEAEHKELKHYKLGYIAGVKQGDIEEIDSDKGYPYKHLGGASVKIEKSGFDPDQPRDERGRWTDSANSNVAEDKHKQITDSLYKMSTDEINTHVRKGNPTIDLILHSWQQSSESVGANVLKEMVVEVEGLHDFKIRPNKDAIRRVIDSNYLTSPIVASCFGIKTVEVLNYKQDNIESGLSYTTVPMTIEGLQKAIKKDPHVAGSIGKAVKDAVFEKIKKSTDPQGAFKKLIDHPMLNKYFSAYNSFNETHYHELRAAGQVMMEKQGYPNRLTLYRGLAVPLTKEVCLNICKSVASGDRNYTLKIPADPISSYTTLHKVAEDFAENTAKSINEVGIVIHAPTKREDILIPSKLIQFNEGKEKEHIVINRGHIQNVKLKNTIPPEFSELKSVMRYSVSNNKEDPYYRKLLSMESEYTLNRGAIIKEVLSKDRRDKPYQYDSPYADTLAKAGFNEDQPRDDKGRWTGSGGGSTSAFDKRVESLSKYTAQLGVDRNVQAIHSMQKVKDCLDAWKQGSNDTGAVLLKFVSAEHENIKDFKIRDSHTYAILGMAKEEQLQPLLNKANSILDSMGKKYSDAELYDRYKSYLRSDIKSFGLGNGIDTFMHSTAPSNFYMGKSRGEEFKNKLIESSEMKSLFKEIASSKISVDDYADLKAYTQGILKSQGIDGIRLYRGYGLDQPKQVFEAVRAIASGRKEIKLSEDSISSYTTDSSLATNFRSQMPFYVIKDKVVPNKDILATKEVFRGSESEYIVINRNNGMEKISDVRLPSFKGIVNSMNYYRDRYPDTDKYLKKIEKYKDLYEHHAIHKREIAKAGYDDDQPRDEKGRWSDGGASGKKVSSKDKRKQEVSAFVAKELKDFTVDRVVSNRLSSLESKHTLIKDGYYGNYKNFLSRIENPKDPIDKLYSQEYYDELKELQLLKEGKHPLIENHKAASDRFTYLIKKQASLNKVSEKLRPLMADIETIIYPDEGSSERGDSLKAMERINNSHLKHILSSPMWESILDLKIREDLYYNETSLQQGIKTELRQLMDGRHEIQHVGKEKFTQNYNRYNEYIKETSDSLREHGIRLSLTRYDTNASRFKENLMLKDLKGITKAVDDTVKLTGSNLSVKHIEVLKSLESKDGNKVYGMAWCYKQYGKRFGKIQLSMGTSSGLPPEGVQSESIRRWLNGGRDVERGTPYDRPTLSYNSRTEGVLRHEMGHFFLTAFETKIKDATSRSGFVESLAVSDYARTNLHEGIAENYTLWSGGLKDKMDPSIRLLFDECANLGLSRKNRR